MIALKGNKYGTVSRKALAKLVESGALEAKCEGHYTDDYAWDNAVNFGRTDWKPAVICEHQCRGHQPGTIQFTLDDFSSGYRTGYARLQPDGTIRFAIHSNLSYLLRAKGGAQ